MNDASRRQTKEMSFYESIYHDALVKNGIIKSWEKTKQKSFMI